MNSKKIYNTNEIPVMTLSEVFKTLVAVSHGDQEAPNWAGKKVYIGFEAKEYWENLDSKGDCL
jgi:hypothetical protein